MFDLGNGRVLRRNRQRAKTSEYEAEVMRYAREWGYPVPAVYEVSGPDMVMDRVDGPTMLKDLGTRPWMLWQHARTLGKLHRQLHGIPAPDWMPTYASHPAFAELPPPAPGSEASPAIPDAILHLDLHPDNVILSPAGPGRDRLAERAARRRRHRRRHDLADHGDVRGAGRQPASGG